MTNILTTQKNKLVLLTNKGLAFIDTESIIRIEAKSNYSKLYFNNGKFLVVSKVLGWFEKKLPSDQFIRIHRTHQINKNYIVFFKSNISKIELTTGEYLDVSRRKKSFLLQHFYGAV